MVEIAFCVRTMGAIGPSTRCSLLLTVALRLHRADRFMMRSISLHNERLLRPICSPVIARNRQYEHSSGSEHYFVDLMGKRSENEPQIIQLNRK